ncbi:ABC transporter ATP-binding protein/permease [Nocardia bhagyanarayanae]|uniref:ATP-binding cassette subfamily C protein CydD n=1 Tax=Nocardia bhagyanarayanae TaxID=1215925 RepID=A0A543F565_9NOCA|nr:ATP-binding cassette domain-containing protein [Nocardia bhagyanarayanae]TQM28975.1 ATP-binding cassette subfamily C protein CydD [Nocardia bhagyanarayanae]
MARPPVDPRLWRYARSARRYLVLSVALSVVITASIVVTAVTLARVLAGVITDPGARGFGSWTTELAVLTVSVGARVAASWVQARVAHRAGAGVVAELESAVLAAGARLSPRELESRRTELAVVVGTGLSGLRGYLSGYLPALLLAVLVPPIVLAVIAMHDLVSGGIAVVTLPLIPIFMVLIGLLTQGRAAATLEATTRLSDQLLDLFAGMPTLRALGRESAAAGRSRSVREQGADAARSGSGRDGGVGAARVGSGSAEERQGAVSATGRDADVDRTGRESMRSRRGAESAADSDRVGSGQDSARTMAHRVRDLGDALRSRTMRALRIAFLSSMVLELLATLSVALIAVSIGLRLVFGEMELYAGLVALILAPEVYLPLRMVGERFHAAQDGMAAADKAFAILEPDGVGEPTQDSGAARPESLGSVEFRDLGVRARDGLAPDALSVVLRPGAVTVLTGPNGSGKSTAFLAMLGLVRPENGCVLVDGTDVRELDAEAWWARVAWLPQRPVLVPGTLRENLELLGARAADDSDRAAALEAACAATGFDAVLDELPQRWDTVVGAGGTGLSLGQRQRLALTRVLAADRPVLLLDEPTAHLDAESESAVLAALRAKAREGATVVVIGHRASVLAAADHVVHVRASVYDGVSGS